MKLLAVETATEACSAALYLDGEVIERYQVSPRDHAQLILPMVDGLMREAGLKLADLDALAFGCGPGSFTGVRIATGVIHGIALGGDLPVVPVSTLAAVAQEFFDRNGDRCGTAFTAMDARMGEIYFAVYRRDVSGFAELIGEEKVTPAESIVFQDVSGAGIGTGWGPYRDVLADKLAGRVDLIETDNLPRAGAVVRLGARGYAQGLAVDVEHAQPVYLRNKVAKKESER
ncbi:tRNA (adenosine(37)-N6)-threonylcarbamoyltransferase complex dimerization subunit type 1 TsaB [Candidatus Methylomicrobium oryzae]|jgi:tRNA threonylcarbamoyladenosine biosynthesis protein TsaB|uniref:tRNA (adenosine(37)-N6)-threonylcarbamoyltransferase complex dimerization subunit type 1 TsaB n=1 Tax=Candidatus Methylomicrobium oryzae TaxID=2802053 RepID=UPI0019236D18|nr:tRNA (adenosine(37)-N6)-threonylcarbamoyltransferase complex dimerization subunit type 1 TsaB [Methylomicrobium sp. RS1]MBL1263273.1 tRNA (adenosine(37)-N6)-threonylcarbamoyltransferase complex dimerization subunit type 1 TsaB [Methylomicrobium sp. RS1]